MFKLYAFALFALMSSRASASEPDFYLAMSKCKFTGSPLAGAVEVKTVEAEPFNAACSRVKKTIECELQFKDKSTKKMTYVLDLDSPPILIFRGEKYGDYFVIDQTSRSVASTSRLVDVQALMTKSCAGTFVTSSELDALAKSEVSRKNSLQKKGK